MEPLIRAMRQDEYGLLRNFLYWAIFVPAGQAPPALALVDSPELAKYLEGFGRPGDRCLVAEAGGEVVAAIWSRFWTGEEQGYGFYARDYAEISISVAPAWRGRGIGSRLLRQFITESRLAGVRGLSLSVSPENEARRLYERLGFLVVGERELDVLMVLGLDEGATTGEQLCRPDH